MVETLKIFVEIGEYCLNCYEISVNYSCQGIQPMISLSLQIHYLTFSDGKKKKNKWNLTATIKFKLNCVFGVV